MRVFGGLRDLASNAPLAYPAAETPTLGRLLERMGGEEPALATALREGLADGYLNTLVNGRNARFLAGDDTPLNAGDVVAFLPPIGGG